jgi:hypothetical protein
MKTCYFCGCVTFGSDVLIFFASRQTEWAHESCLEAARKLFERNQAPGYQDVLKYLKKEK